MFKHKRQLIITVGFAAGFVLTTLMSWTSPTSPSYRSLRLFNQENKPKLIIDSGSDQNPGIFFFDSKNLVRLSGGIFPGGKLSCFGLMSRVNSINPKFFFRTDGKNFNPMLFFKNEKDQHRIDLGCDISQPEENPYLVTFDKNGQKFSIEGEFPYINNAGR